jgi:hypothetical protein
MAHGGLLGRSCLADGPLEELLRMEWMTSRMSVAKRVLAALHTSDRVVTFR